MSLISLFFLQGTPSFKWILVLGTFINIYSRLFKKRKKERRTQLQRIFYLCFIKSFYFIFDQIQFKRTILNLPYFRFIRKSNNFQFYRKEKREKDFWIIKSKFENFNSSHFTIHFTVSATEYLLRESCIQVNVARFYGIFRRRKLKG